MAEKTYKVSGMSCGHCAMRVKNALEEIKGVQHGEVDLERASVTVRFEEGTVSFGDMNAAVEEAGYALKE